MTGHHYRNQGILATSRSKRWNGKKETLSTVFLKDVMQQMIAYGDRVQFGQTAIDQKPAYQVINSADKKMAFDGNGHLMHPKEDEFSDASISGILSLEQIRAAIVAGGFRTTTGTRTSRSTSTGVRVSRATTAKAKASDAIDAEKYQYFKANAGTLPEDIRSYSQEISNLMKAGMTAEQAFNDVLNRYF